MSEFETIKRQPFFPSEDLTEENAIQTAYYLQHEQAEQPYASFLRDSLRPIHLTGHQALELFGVSVDYSEAEYNAFCNGFAALEYTLLLVNPRQYDGETAVRKMRELFVEAGDMADLGLAFKYTEWLRTHQNTHNVIAKTGARQGETMKQLHARAMGAHIATELQSPQFPN